MVMKGLGHWATIFRQRPVINVRRLSLLLFSAFIAVNGWASQLQSRRFFSNNGGLIDHISPLLVPDHSASAIQNISMDDRGDLIKRNGYTVIQSTSVFLGYSTWTVLGGGYHKAATGSDFFAIIVGTDVYRIGNTFSTWSKITGSVVLTDSVSNLAQKTDFNDAAIFCNESDTPTYVTASGNAAFINTQTVFGGAKTCATYGNYLVVANTTEGGTAQIARVRWSDINTQNTWPALNYIDAELGDGDPIVSLVAFDESVYIFKKRSIYQMLITGLPGANAFIIRPVTRNIGAWSKNSVKVIPTVGIAFLAQNTAYLLNDSGLTPIGDPIQRTFDTVQRSQWANVVGGVYPKKYQYWLSVSTAGATNTEVLVYDYVQKNWTVYDGMKLSMIAQAEDSTGANLLITGGYTATTWQQDNGTADFPAGASTAISGSYTTGDLFSDSLDITKNFKYLYLITKGDHNYTITVKAAYDLNTNFESTQSISMGSSTSLYDTGVYDTDLYASGSNVITRIELNRSAKTLRLQFTQSDALGSFGIIGWTVVASPEDYRQ